MHRPVFPKGRSLGGCSDLTLLARIKPGFVESLESVTYKTRIKRVLESLQGARVSAHEYQAARLLSDSVERVGAIQSVRVAVLESQDQVMLAVTFDGSWESYIRVLWHKVGSLLDLIFCGTEDYVTAFDHSFEDWRAWAERVQVETGFFYGPPGGTARDVLVHRRLEAMERRGEGGALAQVRAVLPSAEQRVAAILHPTHGARPADEPPVLLPGNFMLTQHESVKSGLQGLAALYRLADLHRPGTPDGEVLRRASIDLLLEFVSLWAAGSIQSEIQEAHESRFARPLDWIFPDGKPTLNVHPGLPGDPADLELPLGPEIIQDVQAGIVRPLPTATHGALLLLKFEDTAACARFLQTVLPCISDGQVDASAHATPGKPVCTLAFTAAGLLVAGMDNDTLDLFPESFRQGMAARAGLLGDVHHNHPRRWRLPRQGLGPWPSKDDRPSGLQTDEIALEQVHAVIQLRCKAPEGVPVDRPLHDKTHPLRGFIDKLLRKLPGTQVLSGQHMARIPRADNKVVEHFGYVDGNGQPEIEPGDGGDANRIHLGEVLLGHDNAAGHACDPDDPTLAQPQRRLALWTRNGSFLVVRKYRQFVGRLERAVETGACQLTAITKAGASAPDQSDRETVYAKLMGRDRDGRSLVTGVAGNRFDYERDPQGSRCPLSAHIRLANPRRIHEPGARPPRLMRRGMSYGPPHQVGQDDDDVDRGLVFMAYNASISEQFEVVQRWLAGANPTGGSSLNSCPIVGVPENGLTRQFRFEHASATVVTVPLEEPKPLFAEPLALTRLEWGLYLFAPSISALQRMSEAPIGWAAQQARPSACPWQASRGRALLVQLKEIERAQGTEAAETAWKTVIEDPESIERLDSASLWAAIRDDHGGLLDTPYGVLVAGRELQHEVLRDAHGRYSIQGQFKRMLEGVGPIYLGMDPGSAYDEQAGAVNQAIMNLAGNESGRLDTYRIAFEAAQARLDAIRKLANERAYNIRSPRWDTSLDAREFIDDVVAALCENWFGIQGSPHFRSGPSDWQWQDGQLPLYPGHFIAMSRYMFQPNPGDMPQELSRRYSLSLVAAMQKFVDEAFTKGAVPQRADGAEAPIAAAIFRHKTKSGDREWVARTMVGVMMGFVAPLTGALVNALRELLRDGRLWELRNRLKGRGDRASASQVLEAALMDALRMRPMPQLIWRTATQTHRLGPAGSHAVNVEPGRKVVLALASGTQQSLEDGSPDGHLMFGGQRTGDGAHPTHACPGYGSAMDALLGALAAFLGRPESLRSGSAPLSFRMEDWTQPPMAGEATGARQPQGLWPREDSKPVPPSVARNWPGDRADLIVAIGDSWVDSPYRSEFYDGSDLRQQLQSFGWDLPKGLVSYLHWGTIATLHDRLGDLRKTLRKIVRNRPDGQVFAGVLISAGGNDSTKSVFGGLLNMSPAQPALNPTRLQEHIAALGDKYRAVLAGIKTELVALNENVPVVIHGYDYSQLPPVKLFPPSGDEGWFQKPLADAGYHKHADWTAALKQLITSFNVMLKGLAEEAEFKNYVRYLDFTGTIEKNWPGQAQSVWIDDLHVRSIALQLMAKEINGLLLKTYP